MYVKRVMERSVRKVWGIFAGVAVSLTALTLDRPLAAAEGFPFDQELLLDAKPMRQANSERPTSKITRLANTIHWLEKNWPNI